MTATPFTIDIPQPVLDDLRSRLERTRWPDAVADAGWDYGADLGAIRDLCRYWADGFDWRAAEARLNELDQFTVALDGTTLHFVHARSGATDAIPLVVLHGWPSSFVQMERIIPLLTDGTPAGLCPSAAKVGYIWDCPRPDVFRSLPHPESLLGLHQGGTNPFIAYRPDDLSDAEQEFVAAADAWQQAEMAYAMEHTSKQQTLSFGLNDSPAGLAAWIIEKFHGWSDGDYATRFERDDLLTNLTIYWATQTIGSSMRLYYETARDPDAQWGRVEVPTAMAMTKDMFPTPREWSARFFNVVRWTELPAGGHFPEWDVPELIADDLRAFYGG